MVKYVLSDEDKAWVGRAIEYNMTPFKIQKKLLDSGYPTDKIDIFVEYYHELKKSMVVSGDLPEISVQEEIVEEVNPEEEKEFKMSVAKYLSGNKKEMKGKEKREVRKWIKNIKRYSMMMKDAIRGFEKELAYFEKQSWDKGRMESEMKYLKEEMIDRIVESKNILEIEHPHTGEEVTKENMKVLDFEELLELMRENVEELDLIVNGKISVEEDGK